MSEISDLRAYLSLPGSVAPADGLEVRVRSVRATRNEVGRPELEIRYSVPGLPDGVAQIPPDDPSAVAEELTAWATEHVRRYRPPRVPTDAELSVDLPTRAELWSMLVNSPAGTRGGRHPRLRRRGCDADPRAHPRAVAASRLRLGARSSARPRCRRRRARRRPWVGHRRGQRDRGQPTPRGGIHRAHRTRPPGVHAPGATRGAQPRLLVTRLADGPHIGIVRHLLAARSARRQPERDGLSDIVGRGRRAPARYERFSPG